MNTKFKWVRRCIFTMVLTLIAGLALNEKGACIANTELQLYDAADITEEETFQQIEPSFDELYDAEKIREIHTPNIFKKPYEALVSYLTDDEEADIIVQTDDTDGDATWSVLDDTIGRQLTKQSFYDDYAVESANDESIYVVENADDADILYESPAPATLKLPQTGTLWLPVFLLSVWGLVIFLIGYLLRKKNDHHKSR